MVSGQELSTPRLEDTLLLREFGKWAREHQGPKRAIPSWVFNITGIRKDEKPPEYVGDIEEEYALWLDSAISGLPDHHRGIISMMYVLRVPVRSIARVLSISAYTVRQERDVALGVLYGMLSSKK